MRRTSTFLLLGIAMLFAQAIQAQPDYRVLLKDTTFLFPDNLKAQLEDTQTMTDEAVAGYYFRLLQFKQMPTATQHQIIAANGVELLAYIPNFTYLAAIPTTFDWQKLTQWQVRGLLPIPIAAKMAQSLYERPFPAWAVKGDRLEVLLKYYKPLEATQILAFCKDEDIELVRQNGQNNYLRATIPMTDIDRIAQLPWVNYLEVAPPPGRTEDRWGRNYHKANLLEQHYGAGSELTGEGISVLVRDDGYIGPHADFQGRLIQDEDLRDGDTNHADGVAGILSGAGNIDPDMRGMAAGALTYNIPYVSDFLDNTLDLHLDDGVVITNSSYSDSCNALSITTQIVDQQAYYNPTLLHVFSAGNSNNNDCGYGAGDQWGNITGGHKQGKNVIATANMDREGNLAASSSRGPAFDGRIKPDIAAHGNGHFSLDDNHQYRSFSGTSAAAPGIAGIAAQLYQLYQEEHGGEVPESGLIKAALLNTASDLGTYGPDFRYGWGQVHALKAAQLLKQNRYLRAEVAQGESQTHTIVVPEGVKEVRIMTYWMEREASDFVSKSLVNDLNTTVQTPAGETTFPLVLNPLPTSNLASPAQPGVDNLNNVEQVRIANPTSGTYELTVDGLLVPFGVKSYFVVYEFIQDEVKLVYPSGGENLVPGVRETIHWESTDNATEFNIFYSLDNGQNWAGIATLNGNTRFFDWFVPDTIATNALFRIVQGNLVDTSEAVMLMHRPEQVRVGQVCPEFVQLQWDTVPGATEYVIYKLGERYMDSIAVTTGFSYDIPVKSPKALDNWFALEARGENGLHSRRSIAVPYEGDLVDCKQEKDFSATRLQLEEREEFVYCENEVEIEIWVKNKGLQAQDSLRVAFQLNEQTPIFEIIADTIAAGDSLLYTFNASALIDSTAAYSFKIWTNAEDENAAFNDTLFFENKLLLLDESQLVGINTVTDFEEGTPDNWLVINPDDSETWESVRVIGADGERSRVVAMYNAFYGAAGVGQQDVLHTSQFDLETDDTMSLALAFDVAYGYVGITDFADTLQIEISTDCGATYQTIYKKGGADLQTLETQGFFAPDGAGDWRREFVDISAYKGQEVVFKIVSISAAGNNLFLDNLGIEYLQQAVVSVTYPLEALCRQIDFPIAAQVDGSVSSLRWNFGQLSRPPVAYGVGPHDINYISDGDKEVMLIVSSPFGMDTIITTLSLGRVPRARFNLTQNDSQITITNNSLDALSYVWDFGDGTTSTEESPTYNYANTGTYNVSLTALNECGEDVDEETLTVEIVVGVGQTPPPFEVQLSPNPTSGDFWLQLEQVPFQEIDMQLLDLTGKVLSAQQLGITNGRLNHKIAGEHLPKGIYWLQLKHDKGVHAFKVVVQ